MRESELLKVVDLAVSRGCTPFLVVITCGTTVLGAFDPVGQVAALARSRGLWVHLDGSFGAPVLFSCAHKSLMAGAELADSVTWNAHKVMGVHQQCSALLFKEARTLDPAHAHGAQYLFQTERKTARCDTGDKTLQCARRCDVLKLWVAWNAIGEDGFGTIVDRLLALSKFCYDEVLRRSSKGFIPVLDAHEFVNICFWVKPKGLKEEDLGLVAPFVKERMVETGNLMVSYMALGEKPNFFRMVCSNPANNEQDIIFMLNTIEEWAHRYPVE